MNVKRVVPSGFCKGVVSAVNLANKTRTSNPDTPIYILGNIVHNSYVTEELTKLGIVTLDDSKCSRYELLDQIDSGIVILTAHGTADAVKNKALKKGLTVVDGTCNDVLKTKDIIVQYLDSGYDVIYFGKNIDIMKKNEVNYALFIQYKRYLFKKHSIRYRREGRCDKRQFLRRLPRQFESTFHTCGRYDRR